MLNILSSCIYLLRSIGLKGAPTVHIKCHLHGRGSGEAHGRLFAVLVAQVGFRHLADIIALVDWEDIS